MKQRIILLFVVVLVILLAGNVFAGGTGVSPSIVEMKDLLRGNEYSKFYKVLNLDDFDKNVTINATGQGAEWVTFRDIKTREVINKFLVNANDDMEFLVVFDIPADTPNGVYNGQFDVVPVDTSTAKNSVSLVVRSIYSLNITGTERIDGTAQGILVKNVESGQPLRINYEFKNTGNVAAATIADISIYSVDKLVDSFTSQGELVPASYQAIQEATWDTENRGTGIFSAEIKILLDGDVIAEKKSEFEIVPRGTFTAEGLVGDIVKPNVWVAKEIGKTSVKFFNTGSIDVTAKVVAEVLKDDKIVDVISGEDTFIKAGASDELEYYFLPEEEGDYTIKAKVVYNGKEANVEETRIKVLSKGFADVNRDGFSSSSVDIVAILIGVVVFLLVISIVFGFLYFRKK